MGKSSKENELKWRSSNGGKAINGDGAKTVVVLRN